jgi:hypothetical protein
MWILFLLVLDFDKFCSISLCNSNMFVWCLCTIFLDRVYATINATVACCYWGWHFATVACSRFLLGSNSIKVNWMCIWATAMIIETCIWAYIESGISIIWNLGVFLLLLLAGTFCYEFGTYYYYTCFKSGIHVIPVINLEHFAINFCAGDLNECSFTNEMSIYFCFSKNGHSLHHIGHAKIFREFLY